MAAVLVCGGQAAVVDGAHDRAQARLGVLEGPRVAEGVLLHLQHWSPPRHLEAAAHDAGEPLSASMARVITARPARVPRVPFPPPLPCSKKELARIGERMAASAETAHDRELFAAALDAYDQRRSAVQNGLDSIDWEQIFHRPINLAISGRTKSIDTLLDKLRRSPTFELPTIQDVAGVRIVGPMSLADQDTLARGIANALEAMQPEHDRQPARIVDRRSEPIAGYRAVHLVVRVVGLPVEIQVRTEMQATWADTYEKFADMFGRPLRYLTWAELSRFAEPTDPREEVQHLQATVAQAAQGLQKISTEGIALLEQLLPVLAVAEADLDQTLIVEDHEVNLRALREAVSGARQQVLNGLQGILARLEPLQSEASLLRWDS